MRETKRGLLRVDRAAVKQAARYDGKRVITSNDDTLTAEDLALGYKQLMRVERFFRGWRGALRLDEVRHLEHPQSLATAVTASLLAAALAHDLTERVNDLAEHQAAADRTAFSPLTPRHPQAQTSPV